jgi:hypothetical protein
MPHYSWLPVFMQEFKGLSASQQQAFLDAVRRYIIDPLRDGKQPPSNIFHKMSGYNIYEFRWDCGGRFRATCLMFTNDAGEVEIEWRRIGSHEIYQNP